MKKTFRAAAVTLAALTLLTLQTMFTSCTKKTELTPVNLKKIEVKRDDCTVYVHPQTEALLAAYRLAEFTYFADHNFDDSDYISGLDKILQSQKDHDFIKLIKSLSKNYQGYYYGVFQIADYISDDFTQISFTKKNIPEELQAFWKKTDPKEFISLFNDFVNKSNFAKLWIIYEPYIKANVLNVADFYDKNAKLLSWSNTYLFDSDNKPEYFIHVSPIMNYRFTTPPLTKNSDGKSIIKIIQSPDFSKEESGIDVNISISIGASIISNLIAENYEKISEPIVRTIDKIIKQNNIELKLTKDYYINCASWYMGFFPAINYANTFLTGEYAQMVLEGLKASFVSEDLWVLQDAFDYYAENRSNYKDFAQFFDSYLVDFINNSNLQIFEDSRRYERI